MTKCTPEFLPFPSVKKRRLEVAFNGGAVSSDGGALLLQLADKRLGLTRSVASTFTDQRRKESCDHTVLDMVRQRIYGLALGYEDLNDHDSLRFDPLLQTALGRDNNLASSPTLCRFENRASRENCIGLSKALVEAFIASFEEPPQSLVLDFDSTDDRIHGEQIGGSYHGFYGEHCFVPLYVFSGSRLLVSYLRPGYARGHTHALAVLALLTKRLREVWPKVKLLYRGDSDFMTSLALRWCEKNRVDYILSMRGHGKKLKNLGLPAMAKAQRAFDRVGEKKFIYTSVRYQSQTRDIKHLWPKPRRVLVKAECNEDGPKVRFVVTSLKGRSKLLYEEWYNPRGDMENRIKEQKLDLSSDRTSCQDFYANQFRLLLTSFAYVLLDSIRRIGLRGGNLAKAQCGTLRSKLLKIGAVVVRNTRRVRIFLSSSYPYKAEFEAVTAQFETS